VSLSAADAEKCAFEHKPGSAENMGLLRFQLIVMRWITVQLGRISVCPVFCP
jgi:hypothetical protein